MRIRFGACLGLVGLVACLLGAASPASAQIGSARYSAIVLDNRTGNVLVQASPDETRHPASLTKMMTLYMVFEALRDGRLTLTSPVTMSEEAASRPPSKLGIGVGQSITVEQAILALVTRSANDVAAAVGERLGGSEERFAQVMTMRARALGMSRTTFRNASGLPDPDQVTTARDMATLGQRLLRDFPDRYHYFGVTHAQFGGVRIRNHNRMLGDYEGVDGIKTGYINASGFNIVTSASRGGHRLVGAVFGGNSWHERDQHMAVLLDQGFQSLGVSPRVDMARAGTGVVRTAEAAPLPRGARPAPAARTARQTTVTRTAAAARTTGARPTVVTPRSANARPPSTPARRPTTTSATPARTTSQPAARPRTTTTRPATAPRPATPTRTTTATRSNLTPTVAVRPPERIRTAEAR